MAHSFYAVNIMLSFCIQLTLWPTQYTLFYRRGTSPFPSVRCSETITITFWPADGAGCIYGDTRCFCDLLPGFKPGKYGQQVATLTNTQASKYYLYTYPFESSHLLSCIKRDDISRILSQFSQAFHRTPFKAMGHGGTEKSASPT